MSHINKIETIQAKIFRNIVNVPWYVRNEDIPRDLEIPTVKEANSSYAKRYKERIATYLNRLAAETINTSNMARKLKRKHPANLTKDITYKHEGGISLGVTIHIIIKQLKSSIKCPNWTN